MCFNTGDRYFDQYNRLIAIIENGDDCVFRISNEHYEYHLQACKVIYKVISYVSKCISSESRVGRSGVMAEPPGCIFTNPTLIELRQEIGQYDWLASPRANDVVL
ncbi:hypothetical protein AVEN_237088-1 [Araneus ventricosus]|uniref:Uncharacterized protein n=1 Tax=Araneus ventricosus TaxID=182803 RepID=A0A4Y2V6D4_ARAVE|nr:hypothetical protein AVEN_237088-1 [Araneus ventricosus]